MALIESLRLLIKRFVTKLKITRPPNRKPSSRVSPNCLLEQCTLYQYSALLLPFPKAGKYTRLLRLSPGDFLDDLHVELEQVLLDDASKYEALSYVWGSTADPVPILVGPSRKHTISVTQNLATALQHLRYTDEFRTLWVDAVCIDQSNLKERSYQVNLMGDIYRAALQVVVWLGPEDDGSFHALNVIHDIGSGIDVNWINQSFKPKVEINNPPSTLLEELQTYGFRHREAHAVSRLLHRQWFERLWIRQEIGLATQAIVCCGKLCVPWHLFRDAICFIYLGGGKLMAALGDQLTSYVPRIKLVYNICRFQVYHLQDLRSDLAQAVCADPRDKIYGILSVLHPYQQTMGIIPDYTQDVALVYQDATIRFINHTKNVSILLQCELQDAPPNMPTWVPDWSTELRAVSFAGGSNNASGNLESIATSKGEGMLSVAGVAVATIKHVQPLHFGDSEDEIQTMLTVLWKMATSNSATSNDTETSQSSAVCDALCGGSFRHSIIPIREDLPDFDSVMHTFKARLVVGALLSGDVDSANEWRKYGARFKPVCRNRCFFVTTEGSVGIAPLSARPGDIVCVLLGGYSTILLRQTGSDAHQVVGQSYIPGTHAGEVLLGPLPEHLRPIRHYDEHSKAFVFAYWNEHTKEVQYKDPRLNKLLLNPGFQSHDQGKNYFPTIVTSVEALRSAGIAAQSFDLV